MCDPRRTDVDRVLRLVARQAGVVSLGRLILGDRSSYPAVMIVRRQEDRPGFYSTHQAIVKDDDSVYYIAGHYDLTSSEAHHDLDLR